LKVGQFSGSLRHTVDNHANVLFRIIRAFPHVLVELFLLHVRGLSMSDLGLC
jgi:hypothetical protein